MKAQIVREPKDILNGACSIVKKNDKIYGMFTEGKQAIKDTVFLREGQSVQVDGTILSDCIFPERIWIELRK